MVEAVKKYYFVVGTLARVWIFAHPRSGEGSYIAMTLRASLQLQERQLNQRECS